VQQKAVHDRDVRRDDHVARGDHAAIADHAAGIALVDRHHLRVLEDLPAHRHERAFQSLQVKARVNRRLVLEAQRGLDGKRQRRAVDERRLDAQPVRGGRVTLQRGALGLLLREHEPGNAAEVAVDRAFIRELRDPFDGVALAGRGETRPVEIEARHQRVVRHIQDFREMRRRLTCLSLADAARLYDGDTATGAREQQRRGDAGDTAADDRDVHRDVALERRVLWSGRRL
jgi:hypothetical protein